MKKKFISIIFILLILLNIINCYNLVYATDIQSEDYELELDYNVEGPLWYVLTVNGLECLNANGDGGFYYLSLLKNNQDGSRTIIEETINTDNLKMKSENEKILKPYIEDGHVLVKGISEGITKLRLIYNYNGKECIKETYWTVRPNPTPYFQVKHSSGLFNIRMAVLLDNSNIEMSNKEQKNVGVYFSTLTTDLVTFPEGYDEENYFICKWTSKDESIVKIKGNDNSASAILEAISPGETEVNCVVKTADGQGEDIIKTVKVSVLKSDEEEPKEEPKEDNDKQNKNPAVVKEDNTIVKDRILPQTGKEYFIIIFIVLCSIFAIYINIKIKKYNYK